MPKKMIWIEKLFMWLPVERKKIRKQILLRLFFLFLVWLTGLAAYALDGLGSQYVSNVQTFLTLFGPGLITLFGSYVIQESLADIVLSIRPLLRLDGHQFKKLLGRIEKYSYSFVPAFLIASSLTVFSSDSANQLKALFEGLHGVWGVSFMFFSNLLTATALWIGASIWLTIFLTSRQPFQAELSQKPIEKFRSLTNLALWFALFYFLAISISIVIPLSRAPIVSMTDLVTSPMLLFIAIGVLSVLLPFYNIHRALAKLKKQELLGIEKELELLEKQLDEAPSRHTRKFSEQSLALINRLFSLQIKERRVKASQEWPINIKFLSRLLGIVLAPVAVDMLIEIIVRLSL